MIRSLLFLPGNSPSMLQNADILGADAIILDLEDAVSPDEKDAARLLVRNALFALNGRGVKTCVRINSIDENGFWKKDLDAVLPMKPDFVMPTKVDGREMVENIAQALTGDTLLMPLIETALGVENAFAIASGPKVYGVLLGAEDLTADLGCPRTKRGDEILYARSRVVMAARAAGVMPIDTPFTDVLDDEGLVIDAGVARALGFAGKAAISPRHIRGINRAFSPTEEEIAYAREVLQTIEDAQAQGKGAVSLRGKMIDAPIVNRAKRVLQQADFITGGGAR